MKHKIMSETPLSIVEVKAELERIKTRDEELNFRAQKTYDFVQRVARLDVKTAAKLKEKLHEITGGKLKEQHLSKLIDVLPTNERDVKVALQKYSIPITAEAVKKIGEAITEASLQ